MFLGLLGIKKFNGLLLGIFLTFFLPSIAFAQFSPITNWKRLNPKVQYVGKSEGFSFSSGTTLTTTACAANPVSGDLIVCGILYENNRTITSVVDANGNTYTAIQNTTQARDSSVNIALFYKENIVGGAGKTVTITFSGSNTFREMSCHQFSGIVPSGSLDATGTSGSATTTTSITTGPAIANYTKELIFAYVPVGTTPTAGTGYTSLSTQDGDLCEYKIVTRPGSYNILATLSPAGSWAMVYATFRSL